jgi:hypothetical protein
LLTFLETGLVSPAFGARWRGTTNEIIDVVAQFNPFTAAGGCNLGTIAPHSDRSDVPNTV